MLTLWSYIFLQLTRRSDGPIVCTFPHILVHFYEISRRYLAIRHNAYSKHILSKRLCLSVICNVLALCWSRYHYSNWLDETSRPYKRFPYIGGENDDGVFIEPRILQCLSIICNIFALCWSYYHYSNSSTKPRGFTKHSLIAGFMGPTWGPSGADGTQVGPMLAPWTLLSGLFSLHRRWKWWWSFHRAPHPSALAPLPWMTDPYAQPYLKNVIDSTICGYFVQSF